MLADTLKDRIETWTKNDYFDEATRREILEISDPKELEERFCCDLEFGTAGMRGILGAGTNRLNIYVVRKLALGLADTIFDYGEEARRRGVVIAYDGRRCSPEFAREIALVLAARGIKVYIFEDLRPTPELSFAVRHLKTIAGVMITASHNPKEYNGCKVYWEDGGQISPGLAQKIVEKMRARPDWFVAPMEEGEARRRGFLVSVGEEIDAAYLQEVKKGLLNPELIASKGHDMKLVYTPLHGTGYAPVRKLLTQIGFTSVYIVPEQALPDSEFSTVPVPNPEDAAAFELALKYAAEGEADLILATDPDADRLGIMARERDDSYRNFTGNQIGVVLQYYILSQLKKRGFLPKDAVVMKSIASTALAEPIAAAFGVDLVNVPVGFKYIAEQIKAMEEKKSGTFIFGFEESNGYLAGTYARDKDAVQAVALAAEAALYYRQEEDKTLGEVLEEIYRKYGYYLDEQVAMTFGGLQGKSKIERIMKDLRRESRAELGGVPLKRVEDYLTGRGKRLPDGAEYLLQLPKADVLRFAFDGGGYVMARPSGTEPKIRFYFCIRGRSQEEAVETLDEVKRDFFAPLHIGQ